MQYGYIWQTPFSKSATEQAAQMRYLGNMRLVIDHDFFRRGWSDLRVHLQPGDQLNIVSIDALAPSLIGAQTVLKALLQAGVSVTIVDMGRLQVTNDGTLITGAKLLRTLSSLIAAQTRMALAEQHIRQDISQSSTRRGRPAKLTPGQQLAVLDYSTTHTQQEAAQLFHISRATVARIIHRHTQRFK
ncbi:hypothetical protein [Lacticaseibacillus hulanensis]|uniref:hypothetical protein n=1 Tax=Lacticaseibacillus hulanensis TaxID=2493111 RepID=UPI000FDCCFE0|nr:hypothetical protein [Lacticaseibacillus hulanensis]